MKSVRLALWAVLVASLLGCPPVRDNHPNADSIGGSYGEAVAAYRYYPYSNAWVLYLFLPREDDFGCENGTGYGFNDDDNEWLLAYLIRGDQREWEGDYPSRYSPDCEAYNSYQWADALCTSFINGYDEEGVPVPSNEGSSEITSFTDDRIQGSIFYGEVEERFRATNCGELPSYYYDGISEQRPNADIAGDKRGGSEGPSPWQMLRFR